MVPIVYLEKMRPPDPGGLARDRVERPLTGPLAPSVGLVLGPAGSGKTTLLSRVAAASPVASAWYRAGAEDADEVSLVAHVGYALGTALGSEAVAASSRTGSLSVLVKALEQSANHPVQLVVDDLHELSGTSAEAALERFVALRPRRVRLLLGSRRPPALNTPRLLVSGELGQLDAEDLRFRSWEVEELFRTVYREPLSPETAAALTRRTGGWAAGLQLFHLATGGMTRLERERAVEELSGRSRLIRSYLARNVLDGLGPARRSFLLQTCTLGVLSASLCDQLLDRTDSAAMLRELEQEQFFTSSSDDGATYRYHQVLQTHLEVLLVDDWGSARARALYARSAELLERAGLTTSALKAHARAEDWGAVARLLQHTSSALPMDEPPWMAAVPGLARDDPSLVVANARRLLRSGRIAEAVDGFRVAESLLDDPDFRARCCSERDAAAEWLAASPFPDQRHLAVRDRKVRVSRELRQLTRSVAEPQLLSTGLGRGVGLLLAGDRRAAGEELGRVLTEPGRAGWEILAARLAALLAEVQRGHIDDGQVDDGQLEQIVLAADVEGLPWLARVARGLQAALLLAARPSSERLRSATDLVAECDRQGDRWASCLVSLAVGAACAWAAVDAAAADQLLRQAEQTAGHLGAPVLQRWARQLGPRAEGEKSSLSPAVKPAGAGGEAPGRRIELVCLGRFDVLIDGVSAPWRALRPRARSLLMLLALRHGRGVHREELIADLWPDASLASGLRSLQVAVSSVRQCLEGAGLGGNGVQRHGDAYALSLPEAVIDVAEFERLVREAARAETGGRRRVALDDRLAALDLYGGDLIPETGPAEWVLPERDRLRSAAARAGAEAARLALELAEWSIGTRAARRSLELDPYHDESWALLAELLERAGDLTAAAVTRRDHERICAALGL
jgi:DNA-binding SARP family transcriptional activator